jgi:hypothetical protein
MIIDYDEHSRLIIKSEKELLTFKSLFNQTFNLFSKINKDPWVFKVKAKTDNIKFKIKFIKFVKN